MKFNEQMNAREYITKATNDHDDDGGGGGDDDAKFELF